MKKYILNNKYTLSILGVLAIFVSGLIFPLDNNTQAPMNLGVSNPDTSWFNVTSFSGYQTDLDESKLPDGANGRGQNTIANNGDRISIRQQGTEMFPNTEIASTTESPVTSIHTFRQKDGTNIMMRAYGTVMQYYSATSSAWTTLQDGYTEGYKFGFADYNRTLDETSFVYFGNSIEDFSKWTGVNTKLTLTATSGTGVISVVDASKFAATGNIYICDTDYAYSSKTATSFTLTGTTTSECASGTGIPESVETDDTNPKGNIYLAFDNRLLISGNIDDPQAVYFSAYGNANTFLNLTLVSASTDADADIFNLVEGGGPVTGLAMDENSLYMFKRSIIYKVTLTDTDYSVTQLKPFDGRSQTTGLLASGGVFSGGNEVFFITPDNQIMEIKRIENVDVPQIVPISESIQPTTDLMKFDDTTGIVFRDKAYFAAKSNTSANMNDTVLVWNIKEKIWDSPIVGWQVSDFLVYDDGISEELYISDSISPNVYKVIGEIIDNGFEVKSNWRSKQFNFGMQQSLKDMEDLYIEGIMTPNTTLTISLLLDENGVTQTFTTDLSGTDSEYFFGNQDFNLFGLSDFGSKRFGGGDDVTLDSKFRIYLGKDFRPSPFYNAQIEFASEGLNDSWEILGFGFKVIEYSQPNKRTLYKSFK